MTATPRERLHEHATEIAGMVVTGIWLAALVTGQDWWLAALFLGYFVVVPVVALLFGDEDDVDEWWNGDWSWDGSESAGSTDSAGSAEPNNRDALATLRKRYARGELTDEQFERKLDRLLEADTLENVEDAARERERMRSREGEGR